MFARPTGSISLSELLASTEPNLNPINKTCAGDKKSSIIHLFHLSKQQSVLVSLVPLKQAFNQSNFIKKKQFVNCTSATHKAGNRCRL